MFTKAALYERCNAEQKGAALAALEKYSRFLRWQPRERVLDVGSGGGSVTQLLAAHLPSDFRMIVGLDISEEMVKYAVENNTDSRITYMQSDITEVDYHKLRHAFDELHIDTAFDKIFSFTALHWARNYERWATNMYSLLRPGGQVFLMFFAHNSIVDMWNEVVSSDKWLPYTNDIEHVRFRFHDSDDIDGEVAQLMTNAGFVMDSCAHFISYANLNPSDSLYRGLMENINPYIQHIPQELREDYLDDLMETGCKLQKKSNGPGVPLTNVVVVATKPENISTDITKHISVSMENVVH